MTAITSWTLAIVGILLFVLALHQLGVDVTASLGTLLRGTERFLSQPLFAA
jgi:hypothetical protein